MPPLSILLWLPAVCGVPGALIPLLVRGSGPGDDGRRVGIPGALALIGSVAALGLAIGYIVDYKPGAGLTHVTDVVWISELGIHYKLGVDGLNVFLLGLTTLLFAGSVLAANLRSWERPRLF